MLVVRQTMYMLVNVTTYEVLICPPHMQRRFPKRGQRCWYLRDFNLSNSIQNCVGYWTLDNSQDTRDFGIADALDINDTGDACPEMCGSLHLGKNKDRYAAYQLGSLETSRPLRPPHEDE